GGRRRRQGVHAEGLRPDADRRRGRGAGCARARGRRVSIEPRSPSQSTTILSQVMELTDANLANNVHGGTIMKLCDAAAGIAAVKHCGARVVTAAMDEMSFI